MLRHDLIEKTEEFIKRKFDEGEYFSTHPEDKAYRLEHTYRVANIGRKIAEEEGFDETEMVLACMLHDVSYCEVFGEDGAWPQWKDHGRLAAKIARPFLEELGLPEDRIQDICYGIAIHVDYISDFPGEKTPFALAVCEADNIDRFDVYRIHETLVNDGFLKMSFDDKLLYAEKRLARLHELEDVPIMVSGTSKKMWKTRLEFYREFYEKLADQLKCSTEVFD